MLHVTVRDQCSERRSMLAAVGSIPPLIRCTPQTLLASLEFEVTDHLEDDGVITDEGCRNQDSRARDLGRRARAGWTSTDVQGRPAESIWPMGRLVQRSFSMIPARLRVRAVVNRVSGVGELLASST